MRVQDRPPLHLTYCLNVHPGESWETNLAAIRDYAMAVRDRVAPGEPFGLGLRLGAQAADELGRPVALRDFGQFLAEHGLYVFTINGFPYGRFHETAVKENVYRPDWCTPQRRDYTIAMANILSALLPEGVAGSISTVPGSYKGWIRSTDQVRQMACMLADAAMHLARIRECTGRDIVLALEPEPDCYLETTGECVNFLTGPLAVEGAEHLAQSFGLSRSTARAMLTDHVGVCFDASHLAVQFEDLASSLKCLADEGIRVGKVHLSAALRIRGAPDAMDQMRPFVDAVYLHQVKARTKDGRIISYADLPEALAAAEAGPVVEDIAEWRVHFHVPLFFAGRGSLESTSDLLAGEFAELLRRGAAEHLEIETYTFAVLPEAMKARGLIDSIAEEYQWVFRNVLR